MPHARMARNLNQSIFAILVGTIFSGLIIALFTTNALILAIFEIPLAILVELFVVTECIYSYKDEVSIQTTFNMIKPLLKSLLISIPIVIFYSAIILILEYSIESLDNALNPLFTETIQGLEVFLAIPIINFIPVFIMIFATPFLLYVYGKVHILIWGSSKEKKEEIKAELQAKEKEEEQQKLSEILGVLNNNMVQLQQYLLELQAFDGMISSIDSHESYKTVNLRLTMIKEYIVSLGIEETKENKAFLKENEVSKKIKDIEMQKTTISDIIEQKTKKLKKDKGIFDKVEETEEYIKGDLKKKKKAPIEDSEQTTDYEEIEEKKELPEPPEEKKELPEPPEEKKELPEPPEEEKEKEFDKGSIETENENDEEKLNDD